MRRHVILAFLILWGAFLAAPAEAKKKKEPEASAALPVAAAPPAVQGGAAVGGGQAAGLGALPAVFPDVTGIQAQVDGALRASEALKGTTLDQLREISLVSQQLEHHRQILSQSQVLTANTVDIQQTALQAVEMEKVRLIAEEAMRQQRILSQVQQLQSQNLQVLRTLQDAERANRLVRVLEKMMARRAQRRLSARAPAKAAEVRQRGK